nr:hypothetical protein TR92_10025 [Brucella anthropi]
MATFVDAGDDLIRSKPLVDPRWRPGTRATVPKICIVGIYLSGRGHSWTAACAENSAWFAGTGMADIVSIA